MLTTWLEHCGITEYSVVLLRSVPTQRERFEALLREGGSLAPNPLWKGFLTKQQHRNAQKANVEQCYALSVFLPFRSAAHDPKGNLPLYAMSLDYHRWAKALLKEGQQMVDAAYPNHFLYGQCDTGPLQERTFAIQSGLCLQGINALAIHPLYGSYGVLALFITDLPQTIRSKKSAWCRRCGKCQEACPGQAILEEGRMDWSRCASHLSQEKRSLSLQEEVLVRKSKKIFGCDRCQEVCPENEHARLTPLPYFKQSILCTLTGQDLQEQSKKEFLDRYGDRAFAWRGRAVLQRNLRLLEQGAPGDLL